MEMGMTPIPDPREILQARSGCGFLPFPEPHSFKSEPIVQFEKDGLQRFDLQLKEGVSGLCDITEAACVRGNNAEQLRRHAEIGRAHVLTPVTNAHLVCRLLL